MTKFEEVLKKWNKGLLFGAKKRLSREINLPHTNISNWIAGRQDPSESAIKKMSKIFKKSEDEIKNIFGINDKETRVYRSKEERVPILGIVKNGEIIFFSLDNIPGKEDMQMQKKFVLQIRGTSNPDFKPGDELTIICMDSVQGYEGNYCVIKKGNELYLKKLTKGLSSKENVIGLMCAHKRITLDIK